MWHCRFFCALWDDGVLSSKTAEWFMATDGRRSDVLRIWILREHTHVLGNQIHTSPFATAVAPTNASIYHIVPCDVDNGIVSQSDVPPLKFRWIQRGTVSFSG